MGRAAPTPPGRPPPAAAPLRRPEWIRVRAPSGETYEWLRDLMRNKDLHTVCEEARCPNVGECWGAGTATFLMMGDICTRSCGFWDIATGGPSPARWGGSWGAPRRAPPHQRGGAPPPLPHGPAAGSLRMGPGHALAGQAPR